MAYLDRNEFENIKKLRPIIGLGFPMKRSSGGFFRKQKNLDVIAAQLKQLLNTERGERVMRPDFGVKLRQFVFEPLDDTLKQQIRDVVEYAINVYGNEVELVDLEVFEDTRQGYEDLGALIIRIKIAWILDPSKVQEIEVNIA